MKDKEYYSFIWEIPTWGGFPVGLPKQYAKKLSVFHRLNKYVEADPDTGLDQYEVDGYYTNTEVDEILNVVIDYLKEQIKNTIETCTPKLENMYKNSILYLDKYKNESDFENLEINPCSSIEIKLNNKTGEII